ncbi:hypothetical protein EX895_002582 [Sporisorium graminicola]|uniref:Ras-GAP domain-containing protein n=1 Tax=Sporisorium graminicola TaxID=280036 RepID=A0A4U7KVJ2_9BASI|nr:hypothetical protein EX895_002582 [Sporisorium graminicola]TKY88593.1 hypothetical protein EX895_002582 [Sporisorium graminicola]
MSGAHPLWPDYAQQQQQHSQGARGFRSAAFPGTAATNASSASTSASISSPSSLRRMVANFSSSPSSPSSSKFTRTPLSTVAAQDASLDQAAERGPMHSSMDRAHPRSAAPLAPRTSPTYLHSSASAHDINATPPRSASASTSTWSLSPASAAHQQQFRPQLRDEQHTLRSPSSTAAIQSLHRLPSSSSYDSSSASSSPSSAGAHAASSSSSSRGTDATAREHRAFHLQQHSTDASRSSYTLSQLPPSTFISSSTSRADLHPQPSSARPSASSFSPEVSRSPAQALDAVSSPRPQQSDMKLNKAALEPTSPSLPPPPSASRSGASFARLRSESASTYTSSRAATAGDAQVSLGVLVWWPSTSKSSSSTLARTPLFRDAAHVKQKLSMRPSASNNNRTSEPGHDPIFERASFGFRNGGSSWLREKPSKARLNSPSSSVGLLGQWKRATLLVRENGSISIFGDGNALTHTLFCGALSSSDVRRVDDSLFGRPHVLSIQPRQAPPKSEVSITARKQEAASQPERARSSEPIFLEFKSEQQLQYIRALLLIYIKPEIYGAPATLHSGGTHRFFRQLDITISDAKNIMPRWPTELGDSGPEFAASPPSPFNSHALAHGQQSASPTATSAGGASTASNDLPRSLSHQLAALRFEDQDDSPNSEPFTEDTLSGSSRANSRPNSRPSSRLRHNARPSVSSIRTHHDLDDTVGSGSSRSASRPASHYDNQSLAGDDASSIGEPASGPLSGHSGAHRFVPIPTSSSETPFTVYSTVGGASSYNAGFKAATQQRRIEDKDRFEKARFDRYCRIRLDGELVARTSLSHSSSNAFAFDKFKLDDVGDAKSLVIEVLHPTLKTGSSLSGSPSQVASKYMMLGIVEIPIETLRRNEEVEGRFPIWSISTFPSLSQQAVEEDEARIPTSFHRGVVGEFNLSIRLHEGAVMPLSMYDEVLRRIHDVDAAEVVRHLSTYMREDLIISHLIRVYAASGTIAERISSLIEIESVNWGEKMEPQLLFRANTLLSRSVDHFQRLLALSWLDDCLGPTVRKICHDPLAPSRPDTGASTGSAGSAVGDESQFDFSTSMRSPPLLPSNALDAIPDGPMTTDALQKLSDNMWQNIYRHRHSCPPDLRVVLHQIRRKVNERYRSSKSTRPGIQGVGAFVFLRLFCAALNAPQLYGLTPSQPGRGAQRKLLLLSKVLLALASKKTAFDKEKDWELVPLNEFLRTYSSAYDDYISVVSTEPPTAASVQLLGVRIEGDADLQAAALRRLSSLSPLHREAVPRAPYMLDQPQAIASFVCFVADAAQEHDQALTSAWTEMQHDDALAASAGPSATSASESDGARIKRKAHELVQICYRIEDAAGMCIEQAGYDPRPIPWERLQTSAMR